ncbi:MAG: ferredoxin [Pseudomonadota bacterium]
MARLRKRRWANTEGDFYVDATCIDCGTCRWVAPDNFDASGNKSCVYHQQSTVSVGCCQQEASYPE